MTEANTGKNVAGIGSGLNQPLSKRVRPFRKETGYLMGIMRLFAIMLVASLSYSAEPGVIKVLKDFESGTKLSAKGYAGITTETSRESESGRSCLKVTVAKDFNWRRQGLNGPQDTPLDVAELAVISGPYLPPEADAVRMRVRVASGRAIITVGGPVSQIGNSDVYCDPQLANVADGKAWRTLELSLNRRLVRNFRRPGFSGDLPAVYYTRWAQEPIRLYLAALPGPLRPAEDTVLFIDRIELLTRGEGKPFPEFDPTRVKTVATIADFDSEQDQAKVVSVGHGYSLISSFLAGYRRAATNESGALPEHVLRTSPFIREEGIPYPAPRYSRVEGRNGTGALQAECVWAEEGQIVTLKTRGNDGANALAFAIKPNLPATASGAYAFEYGSKRANAVDVIVFVAPAGAEFPWQDFEATAELKRTLRDSGYQGPGTRYDYLLAMDRTVKGVRVSDIRQAGSFGFYTARRYVPAGEWSTVIIPFEDFVAVYGQGACKDMQAHQRALAPENIAAIGYLMPFGSGHGTIALDDIAYVRVPGDPRDLRSFWQVPDVSAVRLTPLPRYSQYKTWMMMTLGEDAPTFLTMESRGP